MKYMKYVGIFLLVFVYVAGAWAASGRIAGEEDVKLLKTDLKNGLIKIGKTRLKTIQETYGNAQAITNSERKLVYDYGDLKVEFEKKKIWTNWAYDTFKKPVYTDDVDDLRFDLESEKLVGENITFAKIRGDYDEPTESYPTEDDGESSVYYYGDIKMTFENVVVVQSWRGKNLEVSTESEGVLGGAK